MAANKSDSVLGSEAKAVESGERETRRCCFDCDFFMPYCTDDASELTESDWKTGAEDGECHYGPPCLGPMIKTKLDEERFYGEWPRVMYSDWCGRFVRRKKPCRAASLPADMPRTQAAAPKTGMYEFHRWPTPQEKDVTDPELIREWEECVAGSLSDGLAERDARRIAWDRIMGGYVKSLKENRR